MGKASLRLGLGFRPANTPHVGNSRRSEQRRSNLGQPTAVVVGRRPEGRDAILIVPEQGQRARPHMLRNNGPRTRQYRRSDYRARGRRRWISNSRHDEEGNNAPLRNRHSRGFRRPGRRAEEDNPQVCHLRGAHLYRSIQATTSAFRRDAATVRVTGAVQLSTNDCTPGHKMPGVQEVRSGVLGRSQRQEDHLRLQHSGSAVYFVREATPSWAGQPWHSNRRRSRDAPTNDPSALGTAPTRREKKWLFSERIVPHPLLLPTATP